MFGERECHPMSKKANPAALLPILVFLVLYLGLGLVFEYVLKIPMGFYSIPIVVIFLIALLVACCQNRALSFDEKLTLMGYGVGDKNIITMLLIFLAAGMFVGVVGRSSAESVAYFMLSIIPSKFAVAVLFVVSCFVSTAMGTSVGTITLITPIAIPIAAASGYSLPLCVASVMGGAMFGDNLSFISDTTIAACNGQGCAMKDKFRENFHIAFPAALASLALVLVLTLNADVHPAPIPAYNLIQIIPYVLVLIGGIIGIVAIVILGLHFGFVMSRTAWIVTIGIYIAVASLVPVWILLQPRDYLSSFLLYGMMLLALVGIFVAAATGRSNFNIPAFTGWNTSIGTLFPALFITVACGACSGFHSLIATGTSSKQLDNEKHA